MTFAVKSSTRYFFGVVLAASALSAQPTLPQNSLVNDLMLWRGIDAMYSYEFHESAASLDSVMRLDPDNSVAPFVAVANVWLMAMTEQGIAQSHEILLNAIDETIPRYELMMARRGAEADVLLFMGSTYGMRGRVALANKDWASVIYSGLKGWSLIRRAHEADSTLGDAYLPLGIFDYYASMSSLPVQLVARIFGITPDRAQGLAELKRAADEAPVAWIEAASTLAIIYLYIENDPQSATEYTERLISRYPQNYYFNFLNAEMLIGVGRIDEVREAIPHLTEMFATTHPNQQLEWALKLASLEASLAFAEGHYVKAMQRCNWIIDNYDMEFDWHLGFAYNIRGRIYEKKGEIAQARADFLSTMRLGNKTFAVAAAEESLRNLVKRRK